MNVTLKTDPPGAIIFTTSAYIDLACDLNIDSSNGIDIFFTWTGPDGTITDGPNYNITNHVDNSTLIITQYDISRDYNAMYTCSVTAVVGNATVRGNNSLILPVQGMLKVICSYLQPLTRREVQYWVETCGF